MNEAPVTEEQLRQASTEGEKQATKALSILAKREVTVTTTNVQSLAIAQAQETLDKVKEHAVIAYTKAISGVTGTCLLSMERKDALNLVDLFNNRPAGTTVVMQEIDRSTIQETLNILGNAYITQLAKLLGKTVMLNVPRMATKDKLNELAVLSNRNPAQSVVLFETSLNVAGVDFQLVLYFFFLTSGD